MDANLKKLKKVKRIRERFELMDSVEAGKFYTAFDQEQTLRTLLQQLKGTINKKERLYENESGLEEANRLAGQIKERIREVSKGMLEEFNQHYRTDFTLEEIIRDHENFYYSEGLMAIIRRKNLLQHVFNKEISTILPSHPKDEFPETRKLKRSFVIHAGPTNSGKTHHALQQLKKAQNGLYLAPLRLLALEVYERLNAEGVRCNLVTGEEEISHPRVRHTSCTIEKADFSRIHDMVVIDEAQMIGDAQRGNAWTKAILGIRAKEIHICCSPIALPIIQKLLDDCEDDYVIEEHERQTPLVFENRPFRFPRDVKKGDALIVFSRKMVLQVAASLADQKLSASVIYGNLPPDTRRRQVERFLSGKTDVVVATDAIGMGLNLPIKRVVFLETEKFDGEEHRPLRVQEVKQIAGRAGRKGIYEEGFVNTFTRRTLIKSSLSKGESSLQSVYLAPMEETILQLPFGTLEERLRAWADYEIEVPYFEKTDISTQLDLLVYAKSFENVLTNEQLYKAIHIPFSERNDILVSQWLKYLDELSEHESSLSKPYPRSKDLAGLETYFKALDLYYSFSKMFHLDMDYTWIEEERDHISKEIHRLLTTKIKHYRKKCSSCRKPLPWNAIHGICDKCYGGRWENDW
ncbi:helicase-related protein [Bacillus songklensis]|uniref:RNA helicase n=1 Tax=Bacillus songklensis TaxID=1069116 RepID=A0ABV8B6R7_9BACI